jgi:hypothetical protein
VKTSFTYLADTVIEFVVDGENMRVNVLPRDDTTQITDVVTTDVLPQPAPLTVGSDSPLAPTPKQRTVKGLIRTMWTAVFSFGGEALVYGLNNLTALNLPPGVGLAVGALGYGAKAAIFPNTKL